MTEEHKERFAEALARMAGDEELLTAMGAMVIDDAPEVMAELDHQIPNGELAKAASTAHKLKGLLSTFDTNEAVLAVQELITSAKAENQAECETQWPRCKHASTQLLAEVRDVVDQAS